MSAPFVVRPRDRGAGEPVVRRRTDAATPAAAAATGPLPAARAAYAPWVPAPRAAGDGPTDPAATPAPLAMPNASGASHPGIPPYRERHPVLAPFETYLDDREVTDLFVNGSAGLFVDRGAGPVRAREWRATDEEVRDLAVALIAAGGRHIDDAAPCVDVRLDSGIRVHAVLPPIAPAGTAISVRVPRLSGAALDDLRSAGMFDDSMHRHLREAIAARSNLLVSGAAGAGKTTLLAALLREAPANERIVTIEDVAELQVGHPHHVRLEARQPNLEGAGGIGLARLVREALRMRPDRLVVGECRGEEVRELLSALNTGHDGGAGTVHANGLHDVPARLEALGALAGLDDHALARQAASAIDLVLHVERGRDGARRLAAVGRPIVDPGGRLGIEEVRWSAA
ncbi:TadA family conjugal transfer-associated ATPase [Microbacterium cremeum]|uniref:TadA family conjugal transfer-associated ATPase n=1 Tax=Microbacterium cremeum TaxID=2782169 RepID=UPI001E5BD86C|nr:TadA family conjugal transfer-associated ATPase [Microbacterium cremeum]